jgi:hypothetical protein
MPLARHAAIAGVALLLSALIAPASALAGPPPGPFGPIQQTYEIPANATRVIYVAPDGNPDATGDSIDSPTTIEAAFERATDGDALILRGGLYRAGELITNQGITIQPYENERPVFKGTKVATDWQPVRGAEGQRLWRTKWDTLFPLPPQPWWRREREIARTPLHKFNNDMVFVDGEQLASAGSAQDVDRNSFWIDYDQGYVYIGANPDNRTVEITAWDGGILRTIRPVHGKQPSDKGITVRGVDFTQYAFRAIELEGRDPRGPSDEADHGNDFTHSTFEHCSFTHCSRVGGYFRGDHLTIRHCLVSDTGTEGIFVLAADDALLERNIVERNNNEGITGYYVTAVKIFNQCHRTIVRENLIRDNPAESSGVWYDVGNHDGVFINNIVENTDNGFFFEISQGAICAGNVFVNCNTGVKILNSRDVHVVGNTLINSRIQIERTTRSAENDHFDWHPASGPGVDEREGHEILGNLLVADGDFREPSIRFDQAQGLRDRLTGSQITALRGNAFVRRGPLENQPLIIDARAWNPETWDRYTDLASFREQHPGLAEGNRALVGYAGPVFVGEHLSNFGLLAEFPLAGTQADLPDDIAQRLQEIRSEGGSPNATLAHPGAFPVE